MAVAAAQAVKMVAMAMVAVVDGMVGGGGFRSGVCGGGC